MAWTGRVVLLIASVVAAAGQGTELGKRVMRSGDSFAYPLRAEGERFVWITVAAPRMDVVLRFDGAESSQREMFWVVPRAGEFPVTVRVVGGEGDVAVTLRALRVPTADDRRRVAAFVKTMEAAALQERRQGTAALTRQAVAKYLEVLPVWRELGAGNWEGYVGHQLGNAYLNLQELAKAREALLDALPFRRATGDPRLQALTLSTLAAVYNNLGEYREAVRYAEEALPLRREAGDRKGEANTLNNLAFSYNRLNKRGKALELNLQALAIRREIGDREGLALGLGNLSVAYRFMGLAEKGLAMGAEQLAVARELGDDRAVADALSGLGLSHFLLGDVQKAHGYWTEAEPLYQRVGDTFGLASAYSGLGATNARMRRYAESEGYYERSLALRRKSQDAQGQVSSLLGLCSVGNKTGELARAGASGEEALAIARRLGVQQSIGRSLRCLGDLDRRAGKWEPARNRLTEATVVLRGTGADAVDLSLALASLAAVELQLGNLQKALEILKEAQGLVETERAGLSGDLRASLRASRGDLYAMEVDVYMRQHMAEPARGFDALALEASERSRARSLIESVADARVDLREEVTAEQREREAALAGRIEAAQAALLRGKTKELERALGAAERELDLHQISVRAATVSAFAKAQYAGTLGREALRRELQGSGRALVEYVLGEQHSYVFVLTGEGLRSAVLPGRAEIEKQVAVYRQELSARVTGLTVAGALARIDTQSRRLYRLLVAPVEPALAGSRELVVVPDGVLAYVPFETLTGEAPLIAKFAIGYAPSASALAGLRKRAGAGTARTFLALGDPVYGDAAQRAGYADRGLELTQLPNTRAEVTAIGALFRPSERQIYLGAEANEGRLKGADLEGVRYLHVAAHGLVDEETPGRSGVVLSDGVLQVPEILRLRLRAEMVTLSACQTGLGKVMAGEGVMGLSRAFLFSGGRSVVVSLWNVNDAATAELMKAFYGNLRKGVGAAEALRLAKLGMVNGPQRAWRHPYFWAGFVFVGDSPSRPGG